MRCRVAVVGAGRVGRRLATLAKAFGMRVIGVNHTVPIAEEVSGLGFDSLIGLDQLEDVMAESDFVVVALALAEGTRNLIDRRALAALKDDACLVNIARAEIVEEEALFAALQTRQIRSAALDVWYHEPRAPGESPAPAAYPFHELDNVIMSPHNSGVTTGLVARRLKFAAANVDRLGRGDPILNVIPAGSC